MVHVWNIWICSHRENTVCANTKDLKECVFMYIMRAKISVPLVLHSSEFHRVTAIVKWAEGRAWDDVATIHRETANCKRASRGCIRRSVKTCERHTEKSTPMCYNRVICSLGVMLRWWYDSPRQETCFWPSSGWDLRGSGEIRYHFIQLFFLKLTGS